MKKPPSLTVMLAGLAMLGPFCIDTYLPSFGAIARDFDVAPVLVQQTLSVYLVFFAGMMLFHGTLSDSFGRRPVILASLGVFTLVSVGAALAPQLGWMIAFRALQGLSAGAGTVVGRAMIRDLLSGPKAQKMLSDVTIVFAAAPAVAPILGGWLQVWFGWLFIPLVSGLVVGATAAGRLAHRWKTARLIKTGYALMSAAALLGLGYNLLFPAQVPWAVMPLFLYTLGMVLALNVFPAMRGLAASMQAFLQMLLFALVAGTVAPLIGGNALWLALFHAACVVASLGCMLAITRLPSRFDQTA